MARNKFLKRMAVTALAASMTFGAVPAMATPALAASTVTVDENANYLGEKVRSDVERILQNMSDVTSATTADDIKKVITSSPDFSNYNIEVTITDPDGHGTPSGYYDDGQHYDAQGKYHDYHNFGKISGTVMLSAKDNTTPDSQGTTLYNFVLEENTYTAEEKIALAEHFIQKYFDDVKPFNASDVKVEDKDGDVIGNPTMTTMAQAALKYYAGKGITELDDGSITVGDATNTSAPVNDDKNNTMSFTSDIPVSVGKTSHTKTYTATRDRAHHYLTREFATAVQNYLEDSRTTFANDIDAEKLAGVINNLRSELSNGKGVGSSNTDDGTPEDGIYRNNFNGQVFVEALGQAGIKDYAQLKHISISATDIKIGEANKKLAKHNVTGHVSVDFQLKEDGYNDDQVFTANLNLKESADEMLTEMTDEMTRLFNAGDTTKDLISRIQSSTPFSEYASAPKYDDKTTESKADDTLGTVTADEFANALLSKAGEKKFNDLKDPDVSGKRSSYLSDDHVSLVPNSAVYSDYVEPTTKADGSVKITATVQVQNPWYATYDGTMTKDEQFVKKDVTFTVALPKLKTVAATDIELANARTIYILRGEDGKLKPTVKDLGYRDLTKAESTHQMLYTKPATANDIVWTSSDPSIATVDENGKVTALKGGTAVITASSATNPKISDSITIYVTEEDEGFADVTDPSAYYFDPVYWAKRSKVTNGTTDTTFSPSNSVTRGQMITWLYRYAGSPEVSATTKFADVKSSDYYAKAVAWATAQGITNGTSDTTFSPEKDVTRAEMITFLYRYSQAVGKTDGETGKSNFADVASNKFYAPAVAWGASNGVVAGYADGTYKPGAKCTRAEGLTFIYRAVTHTKGDRADNLLKKDL